MHAKGQHQFSLLNEPCRGLQPWLAVHAHNPPDQWMRFVTAALRVQPSEHRCMEFLCQPQDFWSRVHTTMADGNEDLAIIVGHSFLQFHDDAFDHVSVHWPGADLRESLHHRQRGKGHRALCCLDVHRDRQVNTSALRQRRGDCVPQQGNKRFTAGNILAEGNATASKEARLIHVLELAVAQTLPGLQPSDGYNCALVQICFHEACREIGGPGA
mmetsp:Transcript_22309/g.52107  ORF Transcript_22309/g.52107 Transcript_22309/m.52107 type:complete len:214 (+) Transcript_22309:1087-1728(+)